jgi:hypothetical protein
MAGSCGRHLKIDPDTELKLGPGNYVLKTAQYLIRFSGVTWAAHNLFVLEDEAGRPRAELNGLAFDPRRHVINTTGLTGKLFAYLSLSPEQPGAPMAQAHHALHHPGWRHWPVLAGDAATLQARLDAMLARGAQINARALTYRALSCNSNALHLDLARAAGLDEALPPEVLRGVPRHQQGASLFGPVGARRGV